MVEYMDEQPERINKKPWRFVLNVLVYFLIVFSIAVGLPRLLSWSLGTQYPMAAITSGSMWPVLKKGDLVFIQAVAPSDLKVGDIVVYRNRSNNTLTIHRIIRLSEDTFVTKGDANFAEDTPATYDDLVGRELTVRDLNMRIPYLGSLTMLFSNLRNEDKTSR
jgi:signal peptidase I